MGNLIYYIVAEAELLEQQAKDRKHLENHRPLFRTAMEYGLMFSKNNRGFCGQERGSDSNYTVGFNTINCVSLNLSLGKSDSIIKDVGPIIEDLKEHPYLKFLGEQDYVEVGWKGWKFRHKETGGELLVRAWFENTTKCKKVGTGKFDEVMEVVCEE